MAVGLGAVSVAPSATAAVDVWWPRDLHSRMWCIDRPKWGTRPFFRCQGKSLLSTSMHRPTDGIASRCLHAMAVSESPGNS